MCPSNALSFDDKAKTWDDDPVKVARANAIAQSIREQVSLNTRMSALEFGCGTGLLGFALKDDLGPLSLADTSPGMLAVLQDKIQASGRQDMHVCLVEAGQPALPPASVDLIFTAMTLHHIEDTDKVLQQMYTMLKQPGYLCVADLDAEDGSFHGPDFSGHKGFDRSQLAERAKQVGFETVRFTTVFVMNKGTGPGQTSFPVFLMVAGKTV
ncbi:class I SAM-dependent methyltransferase [Paludibacterium sp. B53371]|uniref:class I SAM-dependent methyltransferase n=1 Tax=Paludibacterium sp. B53371 TaxID=2806263 RepID=UPI001C05C2CA|nr:class I SAM-dependent methyltransferase [Paludibacterium sp. B53371]